MRFFYKSKSIKFSTLSVVFFLTLAFTEKLLAQIIPDNTLGTESSVIQSVDDLRNEIRGGAIRGENLFHSFKQFGVNAGEEVDFANPESISNIFSRVTGDNISEILGTLSVNGAANLFLVNPNGIVFGENAVVNVGGSFMATTADEIQFDGGHNFNAVNPNKPELTIDFPIGLGMGSNPAGISVEDIGHDITVADFELLNKGKNIELGLKNKPQKTFALVGGDINMNGGIITAEGGRIELGSVDGGNVLINPVASQGFSLSYENVNSFNDINLNKNSLIDASGERISSIHVWGKTMKLDNSSLVLIKNTGLLSTEKINISLSESLEMDDIPSNSIRSGIWSETFSSADGKISISAPQIILNNGTQIFSVTYGDASGGDINLSSSSTELYNGSSIFSLTLARGSAGNIDVNTDRLSLETGSIIFALNAFAPTIDAKTGDSGNISINADSIVVKAEANTPSFFIPSTISTSTLANGRAGNVFINTRELKVIDGGRIDSSSFALGDAGSIIIDSDELVEVKNARPDIDNPSSIQSNSRFIGDEIIGINIPNLEDVIPLAAAGEIIIETDRLNILGNSEISVRNESFNSGGNIRIAAEEINIFDSGDLNASTTLGTGGNISIDSNNLKLRNQSQVTASAEGSGDGGNVTIDSNTIVGIENSDINANAIDGVGGNISIDSNAILGLEARSQLTPENDITASSRLGIDGAVEIDSPDGFVRGESLTILKDISLGTDEPLVNNSCNNPYRQRKQGTIVDRGRGGIPESPETYFDSEPTLENLDAPPEQSKGIVEANEVRQLPDGTLELVANLNMQGVENRLCVSGKYKR